MVKRCVKCYQCKKKVDLKKDHHVLVGTYNRAVSKDDETYFHFNCFVDFWDNKVMQKSKAQIELMQDRVKFLIDNPMIKNILDQVNGTDQLREMLKTPLNTKKIDEIKKKINKLKKKKNGKRKKRTK